MEDGEEYAEDELVENTEGDFESDEDGDDAAHQNYSYQDPVQEVCTEDEQTSGEANEQDLSEANQMQSYVHRGEDMMGEDGE